MVELQHQAEYTELDETTALRHARNRMETRGRVVSVVVVYHVTIVSIEHGLLTKFWPFWY